MINNILPTNGDVLQDTALAHVCMYIRDSVRYDNRVLREATALARAGFAVSIIDVETNPTLPLEEEIQGIGIKHIIMPSWGVPTRFKPLFLVKMTWLFMRSVRHLVRAKADVYHAHDDTGLLPAFVAARLGHKRLIFDAHELPLAQHSQAALSVQARLLRSLLASIFPYMLSSCFAVITVSPPIARKIYQRYRVSTVRLARNILPFRSVAKSQRLHHHLGIDPDTHIALYQGNIHAERGLQDLIMAAKFLQPGIVIVMMGKGSVETLAQLNALIASAGVVERVKIIPPVPYAELLDWTASADIGLLLYAPDYAPNIRMCLPNKLFEYLMAGLPVLSSQLDAVTEVIKNYGVGHIVSSLTPIDIANAINAMLSDRVSLAEMHANALRACREELCWEKESQELLSLYQNMLISSPSAAERPLRVCMHVLRRARTDARVMREATALLQAGFLVSIIDVEADASLPREEEVQGISIRHIIIPSWYAPTHFKPWFLAKLAFVILAGSVRLAPERADVYHAYDDHALPACYIAALLHAKHLIFDAPELPLSDPAITRWRRLTRIANWLLTGMIARCAGLIAVSPPIVAEMRRRYHGTEIRLIRNIPPYRVVPKSNKIREYLGLRSDISIALYQGNIQLDRGLHKLVYAARFLNSDIVIVMMGKGPAAVTDAIRSLIERECVADRVKMIPPVAYKTLLDWTASADIGLTVLPPDHSLSIRWCLPNKLFEYVMAGLPVLSSQLDAVEEVIKTYNIGRVLSSLEPMDIATGINTMLADRSELERMHANCKLAAQKLCWEEEKQHLISLYENLSRPRSHHRWHPIVAHLRPGVCDLERLLHPGRTRYNRVTTESPKKVCLFVLRPARTDYRALRTIAALRKEGFAVSIIDIVSEQTAPREEMLDGVHWQHLVIPDWYTARHSQLLFFFVAIKTFFLSMHALLKYRADVYHAIELTALPLCYIVTRVQRKPLVFEAYELHLPVPETCVPFWRHVGPWLLALLVPRCTKVLTVSPPCAAELQRRFRLREVSVVRNIPVYRTVENCNLLRQQLDLPANTCIALYQGGLQSNRGLDTLIRAAHFLADEIVIVLMGAGDVAGLEALIVSEGVVERVKIIPPAPYADLLNWTASADIGLIVLPLDHSLSIRWCLPNKLFECIMAGVPVLATNLDAVVEVIEKYDVGRIVASVTPEAIGNAVNALLADRAARESMRCNALKAAREELHWEAESQALMRLYKDFL